MRKKRTEKRKKLRRTLLVIFGGLAACLVIMAAVIRPYYAEAKDEMYRVLASMDDSAFMREGDTRIYAADGTLIAEMGNEHYEYVPISGISDYITDGYIAKEDRNFTTHSGIDVKSIARAALAYVRNRGEITQGGSTITQQVVKNCLLTQDQTFQRKATEALLAIQIERIYSKAQIMEYYCNYNYYGNGCYGVEGACLYYFGKSAKDVDLAEAALIVATSNAPSTCNPVSDYNASMAKKNRVLDSMLECGYITEDECLAAKDEEPEIVKATENVADEPWLSSYAFHCATLKLMENEGFSFRYTFASKDEQDTYEAEYESAYAVAQEELSSGGFEIETSLDIEAEHELQAAVDEGLAGFTDMDGGMYALQAGAVCIDNSTGMVTAVVGGRSGSGEFNRGYQAKRQPGSTIKPLLDYGPALNEGTLFIGETLTDEPVTVDGYSPTNSSNSYMGKVTARDALVRSINTVALQVFDTAGQDAAMSYLDAMRFSSLSYADMTAPAVSIGGFTEGVTVEDMARGYSALAMGGMMSENDCIVRITDHLGDTVYQASEDMVEIYTEDTAFILTDVLHGTFEESFGLASDADCGGQYYSGKTGTTNTNYDAWFCGYSGYYTTAVWVGYDSPSDLEFYGGDYPLNIWADFMGRMHEGLDEKEPEIPSTVMLKSADGIETVPVPYEEYSYDARPSGYDYCSSLTDRLKNELDEEEREAERERKATAAVEEFEAWQITSTSNAADYMSMYRSAYDLADAVADDGLRASLLERLEEKKTELDAEYEEKWLPLIAEEEENARMREALAAREESLAAYDAEAQRLKEDRIGIVNGYIDSINGCMVKSDALTEMIESAWQALSECSGYDEYGSLYNALAAAQERADSLPDPSSAEPAGAEADDANEADARVDEMYDIKTYDLDEMYDVDADA